MIRIKTDDAVRTMVRLGAKLSAKELARAQSRAINHSLTKGRTIARKEVKEVYNISQRYLDRIYIKRSTSNTLRGEITASRKSIPLDAFAPKQETGSRTVSITKKGAQKVRELKRTRKNPTAGVSIEVKRGHREVVPFAFMIPGGKPRVFARGEYKQGTSKGFVQRHVRVNKTGSDTPIRPLITASIFGMVLNEGVMKGIDRQVRVFYKQRIEHEINVIAKGWERPISKA